MARDVVTVEELQRIANAVRNAADGIEEAVRLMKESDPPTPEVLLHAGTFLNFTMPRLIDWSASIPGEVRSQTQAYVLGVKSSASFHKANNDRRKENARKSAEKSARETSASPAKQATKKPKG